jgi:hypothetical protein
MSPTTGIFGVFALGLVAVGGALIWVWPIAFLGQLLVALVCLDALPAGRIRVPVDEVLLALEGVRVVHRLDLPVRRRTDDRRCRGDPAARAHPDA